MSRNRVTCQGCKHRSTQKQLKISTGICPHCGHDIMRDRWKREVGRNLIMLNFDERNLDTIFDLARKEGIHPTELVKLAVVSRLFTWDSNPDKLKQDRMLHRLVEE